MSKPGTCDLCGHWYGSLIDGVCPSCRKRFNLDAIKQAEQDDATSPYISAITALVQEILHEVMELPDQDTMEHIIEEALFQHHIHARSDPSVDQHIGALGYVPDNSRPLHVSPTTTEQEPQ